MQSRRISPPYSIFFITDFIGGDGPYPQWGVHIQSTPSCITIGCLAFMDGETTVTIGAVGEFANPGKPAFDALIEAPSGEIVVRTAENELVVSATVPPGQTRVRIWQNHPTEPDEIVIGLG